MPYKIIARERDFSFFAFLLDSGLCLPSRLFPLLGDLLEKYRDTRLVVIELIRQGIVREDCWNLWESIYDLVGKRREDKEDQNKKAEADMVLFMGIVVARVPGDPLWN